MKRAATIDGTARSGGVTSPELRVSLRDPLPASIAVGAGTSVLLEGSCEAAGSKIEELWVGVGESRVRASDHRLPPPGSFVGSDWWQALVPIEAVGCSREAVVEVEARLREGGHSTAILGTVMLEAGRPAAVRAAESDRAGDGELVAICLATHDPPLELLRRQLDSIRDQTHRSWICVVSDDHSPLEKWRALVEQVGDDPRFRLQRAPERRGSYLNLELALRLVPDEAAYVALAGQDHRWHPDTLASLIEALGGDDRRLLAHADATVVGEAGEVLGEASWLHGGPRGDDLGSLLLAGGVSGASCLFRRSLLAAALPFPPPIGHARLDRWLALVAAATGRIARVPRPLFDCVEHGPAAFGDAAGAGPARGRWRRGLPVPGRHGRSFGWRSANDLVLTRIVQEAQVLELRFGSEMSRDQARAVSRLASLTTSRRARLGVSLAHLRAVAGDRPSLGGALLRGLAWRRLVRARTGVAELRAGTRSRAARAQARTIAPLQAGLGALARRSVPLPAAAGRLIHVPATGRAERRLRERISSGAPSGRARGPAVCVVVPSRDGRDHLERLLPALERTTYRPLELIVVDNGSADGTAEWLRSGHRIPVRVLENETNRSFSEAVNQGIAAGSSELVLLLNNDVEPATPGWLGLMVETLLDGDAECVGARLIYPRRTGLDNAGDEVRPDLSLQHRGIHFVPDPAGVPRPRNLGTGEDPISDAARSVSEVPAVSAACLLARRETLVEVGALDEGYVYGTEDTDLCLRIAERGGRTVCDGRAALFHHEYATQNVEGREAKRRNRTHNRRRFVERWGPRLSREVMLDRISGAGRWSRLPLRVGITVTTTNERAAYGDLFTARELGTALEGLGYEVVYLETSATAISSASRPVLRAALSRSAAGRSLWAALSSIKRSYDMRRGRWRRDVVGLDVVVVLLDGFPLPEVPRGTVSVAWVRNWTDRWISRPWFDDYDIVLASSPASKRIIDERTAKVARLMPLATNPVRFAPGAGADDLRSDVLFVGSNWGTDRAVGDALPALAERGGLKVRVFGRGWEAVRGMRPLHEGTLPYGRLPAAYASAGVVIDDSAAHTRPYGAVNSRVFDALATGTAVVSNDAEGVRCLFDDEFPAWNDAASLREAIEALRENPERTAALVDRYRRAVLAEHTYDHRAAELREALERWCAAPRFGICAGVPASEPAENWGDYHFARAIQAQLERAGHPSRVHLLEGWDSEDRRRDDVCLHLFGLSRLDLGSGQLNVIWNISHPELVAGELLDAYDLALIASPRFAAGLEPKTRTPVRVLRQATDARRFRPHAERCRYELLFVGNSRRMRRPIVAAAARSAHRLTVFGQGWTEGLLDPRLVAGERIANAELAQHYSAAAIVLNDHWPDMREHGFISNRVYDALACAACVVSDRVEGIDEEFDGAVATWAEGEDLGALIDRLMSSPEERRERGERGRRAVLARHTFDHRAAELLDAVAPLLEERPLAVVRRAPAIAGQPPPAAGARTSAS